MDEWVDIVDEDDQVQGRTTRRAMRQQNLLHRCVAILCRNSQGQIYVHRRTEQKDLFPGMFDTFVAGTVSAGEHYDHAARREIAEELGIVGPIPEALFRYRFEGPHTCSHTAVYRVTWDGKLQHQASEIAWGDYMTVAEILEKSATWRFVPDGWAIFQHYLRAHQSQ